MVFFAFAIFDPSLLPCYIILRKVNLEQAVSSAYSGGKGKGKLRSNNADRGRKGRGSARGDVAVVSAQRTRVESGSVRGRGKGSTTATTTTSTSGRGGGRGNGAKGRGSGSASRVNGSPISPTPASVAKKEGATRKNSEQVLKKGKQMQVHCAPSLNALFRFVVFLVSLHVLSRMHICTCTCVITSYRTDRLNRRPEKKGSMD
jgi:hypothetical protein